MSSRPHAKIGGLEKPGAMVLAWTLALAASGCGGIASRAAGEMGVPDGGKSFTGGVAAAAGSVPDSGDGAVPASGDGAVPASGDTSRAGDTRSASCPKAPPTLQGDGTVVTFQTDPFLAGQPMVYGQPNALPGGGTLTPLNLRFFVSNVDLVGSDGRLVPVDLVTATGTPEPYGLHLFNADDPTSTAWSIRAPAGTYLGMSFILGLSDACNAIPEAVTADSQMTWPRPFGDLFLRYEALIEGVEAGPGDGGVGPLNALPAIAMGGLIGHLFAPIVHVGAPLTVPDAGPVVRHLRFDMDQVFRGATANVDVSHAVPAPPPIAFGEIVAGERLRQTAAQLPIFVLDP